MMHTQDKRGSTERIRLTGVLSEFRDALEEEINQIEKNGQSSTLLLSGRQIESHCTDFWYLFHVDYVPSLPADTPCKLVIGKDYFDITVISFEEDTIIVSSKSPLPSTLGKARLENGATVLMERLIKCIEENAEKENPAGKRMLPLDGCIYPAKKIFDYADLGPREDNTQKQNEAIISALSNDITYIWGPPGTGKTTVIGQLIDELYQHKRSVLIVSHTNTAVDGAIEKADDAYNKSAHNTNTNYPILRIGTPAKQLPDRVLLSQHVAALGKELYAQKHLLEKQQAVLQQRIKEIQPMLAKDNWLKENNLKAIRDTLQNISVYKKEIAEIQDKIEKIQKSITEEKTVHPEYAHYLLLSKAYKSKLNDYNSICGLVESTLNAISILPQKIQNAQDEEKKHSQYAVLRSQETKYMSVSFLKNEITKANEQITHLQNSIHNLTVRETAAQQIIFDFEKKSSVAKLFSSKNVITKAQATMDNVRRELLIARYDLRRQQSLKQEYDQQLEALFLLQDQIRAVTPSKTQEFWHNEVHNLQGKLASAKKVLSSLSAKKDSLYKEVCELEQQQRQAKLSFDTIGELSKKAQQEQDKLAAIKNLCTKDAEICSTQLEKECSLCAAFLYEPTSKGITPLFDELSILIESVKSEMASIDVDAIRKEKEVADQQMIQVFRQLNDLKQKMQELEKQAIMNAKIVGTTLTKTYLSETLRERKFDTVILDEASMASIPALWCASYLAESSIVIVGDFLQLPPIVIANTPMAQKWLGKDIFYHSGMQERARSTTTCPGNFIMLNQQFRMESDIADIANMYYGEYGGLHSNDNDALRVKEREQFYRWYSGEKTRKNVHLIDTESLHAWVTGVPQGKNHSRLNCFSAAVSVELAFKFLEKKLKSLDSATAKPEEKASVLIVAPYKPHVERINQLVELEYHNQGFKENLNFIRAGTIHSFQGSEADIVIFDLVIDEPHWKANLFLTDKEVNEALKKMFNVAITRARFKLFIVGNFAYCQKKAKNNALSELLEKLLQKDHLVKVDAKALLPDIVFTRQSDFAFDGNLKGKHFVCREESFQDYFMTDIRTFKKRLIVYSAFITETRLSTFLPAFADAIRKGKQIIVVTKALSDRSKSEQAQYRKCEAELQKIGVNVLHKKGMHEKLLFVDSEAVWIGSLNALSFTGLTGEVMQRIADRDITADYENLFDIEHLCDAITNTYEQICPVCGGEMLVRESDEGGIYWQCATGDYSRKATQQYPLDGILRCKCGAPYMFSMKNEPRWVCSKDSKHYQKMRESDLKLKKMAALIPTKTVRKEVDRYFTQKRREREAANQTGSKKKKGIPSTQTKNPSRNEVSEEQLTMN